MKSLTLFLLVFLGFLSVTVFAIAFKSKKEKVADYEIYVNEVINQFAKEMKNEYGMKCIGTGGGMPHDVEEIGVRLVLYKKANVEEARLLEVAAIEKLLKIINSNKNLKPFLREYPFRASRVDVMISFNKSDGSRYTDESVALVLNGNDKIFYAKALPVTENLSELCSEPYETALKIVNESKKK